MEEYSIIEIQTNDARVKMGRISKYINELQQKQYGQESADTVLDRVVRIFSDAIKQKANPYQNNNILLVGKVQSGKTSNLEMLTAVAFDNGFNLMIIYGGYDKTLLKQTKDRFAKTFSLPGSSNEYRPLLLSTDSPQDLAALDDEMVEDLIDDKRPIIITAMKRPDALEKVNALLRRLDLTKLNGYIIDDEGDQASLNTKKDKEHDKSSTYQKIVEMKEILGDPIYFSVTATPHANIFLNSLSALMPATARLIEPAKGYCGGESYHMGNSEQIFPIDPDDTLVLDEGRLPESLKTALYHYILASAIMRKRGENNTTMIIHSYRNLDPHSVIYTMVENFATELCENLEDSTLRPVRLHEMEQVFNSIFSDTVKQNTPFSILEDDIGYIAKRMKKPILKNSDGKDTQGLEEQRPYKIYIGGDLLQRGVTFDNLVTTYYTRWANQGNMDTNLQRARWFGYRSKYLDLCRVFTTKEISEQYSILTDIEIDLWEQFDEVQSGQKNISDMVIRADGTKQRPSRSNVISVERLEFRHNWMKQRLGVFDSQIINHNNAVIDRFIDCHEWKDTFAGRTTEDIASAQYVRVNIAEIKDLFRNVEGIFEFEPFDSPERILEGLNEGYVILMPDNEGKGRRRTFYSDDIINNIHQGPDNSDPSKRKYNGDTAVFIDQDMLNVQIHKIQPMKERKEIPDSLQYMFAIRVPGSKTYYVRRDE